jgi:hypothetical protein
MKKQLSLIAVIALAACSDTSVEPAGVTPSFSRNGIQQSVTGHVERDLGFAGVPIEKYSFSAVRTPSGAVNGRFEVHDNYADGTVDKITGVVTCFTIDADGKTARVGGVIESSTNPFVQPGREAIWLVRDNGEGNDVDDVGSDLSWGYLAGAANAFCANNFQGFFVAPPSLSLRGNVQVRP